MSPRQERAETPYYCFGMDRRGKRCPRDRQKPSLLIPISSGLSGHHWFRSCEGEFRYPANIPDCLIGIRKDKIAGRRTVHIVVELSARHCFRSWGTKSAAHQSLDGRSDYDSPTRAEPSIAQASRKLGRNRVDASAHTTPPAVGCVQHRLLVDRDGFWLMPRLGR